MDDNELIRQTAWTWVRGGGDAMGFDYCAAKLRDAIEAETQRVSDDEKARAEIAESKAGFLAQA